MPARGNALAVVLEADGLDDESARAFAAWTDLAETTFALPPRESGADYRVRILTPTASRVRIGGRTHVLIEGTVEL